MRILPVIFITISLILSSALVAGTHKIALVIDMAGLGDRSFNDSAYEGLTRAAKIFNFKPVVGEPLDNNEIKEFIAEYSCKGYDLVIGLGMNMKEPIYKAAKEFPQAKFAIIDSALDLPNVASIVFREEEGAFLAGVSAGYATKSGKVGFVGGMDIPLINRFELGFIQGVKHIDPSISLLTEYAGDTYKAWSVPALGKKIACSMHKNGADIIFHAAGATGIGVIEAARENNFYAIGVDRDQDGIAPGHVLTSMIKRVDQAVYDVIRDTIKGKFKPGTKSLGLSEQGLSLSEFRFTRERMPPAMFIAIEQARRDIISGKIRVNSVKR